MILSGRSVLNCELFGFFTEGKRHDAAMLRLSGLLDQLERHSFDQAGNPLCIYGAPAYPLRVHPQAPFRTGHLTDQEDFNSSMRKVTSSVEWVFGDITSCFACFDFKKKLKIGH